MGINRYIHAINAAKSIADIQAVGVELCQQLGCDYFMYAGIGQVPISSPELMIIGNYPPHWLMRYQQNGYARIDPTVWHSAHNVVPLFWRDVDKSDAVVADFFQDAKDNDIASGVTIPLHSGMGYSAILTFVSTQDSDHIYDVFTSELSQLLMFGYALHNTVIQRHRHHVTGQVDCRERLSDAEKSCLMWASEGKTAWEIGKIMEIKERAVVFHLNNAIKKLGAVNRQHAIACAIALGEIRANIATIPDKYNF